MAGITMPIHEERRPEPGPGAENDELTWDDSDPDVMAWDDDNLIAWDD